MNVRPSAVHDTMWSVDGSETRFQVFLRGSNVAAGRGQRSRARRRRDAIVFANGNFRQHTQRARATRQRSVGVRRCSKGARPPSWARGGRRATVAWRRDALERGRSRRHARTDTEAGRASPRSRRSRVRAASISRRSIPRVVKAEAFTRRARGKSTGRVRAAGTGGDAPQERRDVHRGERVGPRAAGLRADGLVRGRFHGHHGGGG